MPWTKLSDDFSDDCWTLSDAAFRLHVEGLLWSNRKLLDLRIPKQDLRRFAKRKKAVAELLAANWWEEDGDVYVIRHHGNYQRSREAVLAQQAANAANGAKGGRPRKVAAGARAKGASATPEAETEWVGDSLSDSPGESGTERDRTGRDRTGSYGVEDPVDDWPPVRGAGLVSRAPCRFCGHAVDPAVGEDVHPLCAL